jgi:hydantoinase/carbamoylase family amidase
LPFSQGINGEKSQEVYPMIIIERIMRRLDELAQFNATPGKGITRASFTPEDRQARDWFIREADSIGLRTRVDGAGNIFARLERGAGPALLCGSHLDSVPHGGRLDGALGVVGALEVAQILAEAREELSCPFEVVVWADEEGARFSTGLFGSRAVTGQVPHEELTTAKDQGGVLLGDALREFGLGNLENVRFTPGLYRGYFEVHIEQGARLIDEGYQVGIVEGIVGISRLVVTITGQANHAGTTPMDKRHDALQAAARIVLATKELGNRHMPGVATVGMLKPYPGAVNVIPGKVDLTIEIRHIHTETIETMVAEARQFVLQLCSEEGLQVDIQRIKSSQPCLTDPTMKSLLTEEAVRWGYRYLLLPSGAGHDAQNLAGIMPIGMLFVPSIGGISHSPLEDSRAEDIEATMKVLLGAVKQVVGLSALR